MRGSSNTIECGYCGKTIEYLNARLSGSQGKLVCLNCNTVPSIPKPSVDPLYGLPMEDFTLPYVIPTPPRSNSKSNFLNQRLGQAFNPQIMNTPSPVRYRSPSPPLPNLQETIHTKKLLSPLTITPKHKSPIPSPMTNLSEPMEVIPIEEALAQFGLSNVVPSLVQDQPIDLDELVNKEFESFRSYNVPRLHLSRQHDNSDSDINDPSSISSLKPLKGLLEDFQDIHEKNCKSIMHRRSKKKL